MFGCCFGAASVLLRCCLNAAKMLLECRFDIAKALPRCSSRARLTHDPLLLSSWCYDARTARTPR
eukprot:254514-Lingulodinium_polyedra.AAC.1